MLNRRWWDAAVIAASLVTALAMSVGLTDAAAREIAVAIGAILLFAVAYAFVARPGLADRRPWRLPVFAGLAAVALATGCSVQPFFAIFQAIAYPLVWVLAARRRPAIIGSAVVALGVFVGVSLFAGILAGGDGVLGAVGAAVASAAFGFAFAVAFGLWISSIVEYGEERARLVAELTTAQGEVESLSRDRGAAAERERLSRDVHDTLAQTLAGLAILAERAGRQLADERTDAAADTIATVERLSRDALEEARAIVSRTAAVPSDAALGDAVDRLLSRFRAETGLTIDLELRLDSDGVLGRESQLVMLRCLQESLANVRKHAAATRVRVLVSAGPSGGAVLEVVDDGGGFDPAARRDGFGLEGMAERVALAGGEFEISSRPGVGTTLVVRLPGTTSTSEVTG
ncbi:sensor histidine kinase [Microbacterium sp. SSM24]|uniref:sensor histidine kinase n=1 Tax=Microbacterium sp. SSM24 TaxID=2991714 RepID=UPI002226BA5E|nr:sensor histidine kinase [Microbacterium sp. SSM24]MCW3493635.1 sensor histidine kinase [Microbacterium sp. SSM24]